MRKLTVHTVRDAIEDRVTGLAAEVTFFLILAGPPLLLAILGSVGYISEALGPEATGDIRNQILSVASTVLTPAATDTTRNLINTFLLKGRADIISFGAVVALWSASRATNAFLKAVAVAYDVNEPPVGYRRRLLSFGLTIVGVIGAVIVLPLMVVGPRIGRTIGRPLHVGETLGAIWRVAYWPGVLVVSVAFVVVLYHLAPGRLTPWKRDIPGAVVAAVLWMLGGIGLRIYAQFSLTTGGVYGPLAAPMAILLWVYISALALLMGAEVNAELEKTWPASGRRAPPDKQGFD